MLWQAAMLTLLASPSSNSIEATMPVPAGATYTMMLVAGDVEVAREHIDWAWHDNGPCTKLFLCLTYFDSFGANITFGDGSIAPFVHITRALTSAHDCIKNAKDYLGKGDRAMAIQWVMASQIHNEGVRNWLRDHPDAVIAALQSVN